MELIYKMGSTRDLLELDPNLPVMVDTETENFYSNIRLIQVYQRGMKQALLFDVKSSRPGVEVIWEILKDHHIVGHNFLYDLFCFDADLNDFELPKRWDDTFYSSRLTHPEYGKFSLDHVMAQTLGYDPYEEAYLNKKDLQKSFEVTDKKPRVDLTEEQLLYAAIDVYYLDEVWQSVQHAKELFVYDLDIKTAEYQVGIYHKGIPIDLGKLKTLRHKDVKEIYQLNKKLPFGLNVNSWKQVRPVLGVENNSDETTLMMIAHRPKGLEGVIKNVKIDDEWHKIPLEPNYVHKEKYSELALAVLNKRKALKRLNFNDRTLAAMNSEGRIPFHGSPHAINGRIQQQDENLTQWPRPMKSQFGIDPKVHGNRTLIYLDYAQVELRMICALLPERNMYKSLKEGVDLHTFVGNNLGIKEESLPQGITPRFVAKQANFLLLYGGGKDNFQKTVCKLSGVWFPDELNSEIFIKWKDIFSDIKEWHKINAKKANRGDLEDVTASGRRYVAKNYPDLNNIRVSGSASEVFKLAIHYIYKFNVLEGNAYIVNEVHDSIVVDVANDSVEYERISYNVALCFQKAWFVITEQCELSDVPMPVDYAVGDNWEDLEYSKNLKHSGIIPEYHMMKKELKDEIRS